MNKQIINKFSLNRDELEGIDNIISNIPELKEMIKDDDVKLEHIVNAIDKIDSMSDNMKYICKQFFVALQQTNLGYKIYKYKSFKNEELIDTLLQREEQYKKIIKDQAKKHNDKTGLDELNKMFSTMLVETKDNIPLSKYMNKKLKDIKFYDDFKPIFENEGVQTYTKEELKSMKTSRKGPNFRNIDKLTTINVPSLKDGAEIIKK